MSEFSDFTKLVLDRMETNPDEFEVEARWDTLVRGLEARAIGDFENRYAKTLWPLEPPEIEAIMAKYRKLYLARIHKNMLRNIVSGADKEPRTQFFETMRMDSNGSLGIGTSAPFTGGIMRGSSPLTTTAIKTQALSALTTEFDKAYSDAFTNAVVKGEGAMVTMSNTTGSSK